MTACKFLSRGITDKAEGTVRECEEKRCFSQVVAGRWSSQLSRWTEENLSWTMLNGHRVLDQTWIAASKFDKFCKRKFDKRRTLFCAVFDDYRYVYFSAELDGYHNSGSLYDFLEAWLLRWKQPCIAAGNVITGSRPCFISR